nr:protein NUCLEAR FUSION DEFECTIVE 4-like [Ipomoea batatas]
MSGDGGGGGRRDMGSLAVHILTGRWFIFFGCLLLMSAAGGTYIFGIFSEEIKTSLGYDQKTLNLVSFFKEIGANVGIIAGLINEVAPTWLVLLVGAAMNFSGYFFIWLAVTARITHPKVWWICLSICVGANSQTFVHTGALVTLVNNFPESRGIVIGLLKGYVGLSGAIMTQLYHALYGNDDKSLILLIAWLPAAVSCVFMGTIRTTKVVRQSNEVKVFYNLLFVSLGLAAALMAVIILQNRIAFSRADYAATVSVIIVLVFSPLVVVVKEEMKLWRSKNSHPFTAMSNHVWYKNVFTPPKRGEDYTIPQAVLSIDMLVLFVVTMTGAGGTLTAMDNLGQIGKSLGYPDRVAGVLYDNEGLKQMGRKGIIRKGGEDLTCDGVECFKVGFMIIAAATFGGCLLSLILVARTRKFYRGDIYKKFREQARVEDNPLRR